jgi:hypothetical protein
MWRANEKTTTFLLFLGGLFPKTRYIQDASSEDKTIWK